MNCNKTLIEILMKNGENLITTVVNQIEMKQGQMYGKTHKTKKHKLCGDTVTCCYWRRVCFCSKLAFMLENTQCYVEKCS